MTLCVCGHHQERHNDKPHFVYGCSYEPDRAKEPEAWRESIYGVCKCEEFVAAVVPGEPIVFGVHRDPAVKWTTEDEATRERTFAAWVAGAPKDMV